MYPPTIHYRGKLTSLISTLTSLQVLSLKRYKEVKEDMRDLKMVHSDTMNVIYFETFCQSFDRFLLMKGLNTFY